MEAVPRRSVADLPKPLHLHILAFLPLVERVRCALVAHSWNALLADPAFWVELRFDGAAEKSVNEDTLLQLCRRAEGGLRALDISGCACDDVHFDTVYEDLKEEGLAVDLRSLRTWALHRHCFYARQFCITSAEAAAELLAACPALTSAAVDVCMGSSGLEGMVAAMRALPGSGLKRLSINVTVPYSALGAWLPAVLASSTIEVLNCTCLEEENDSVGDAERAVALLAAALASRECAVRSVAITRTWAGAASLPSSICRALTAESSLTALELTSFQVPLDAEAVEIAAALAPGRSRLQTLWLAAADLENGGCAARAPLACCGGTLAAWQLNARSSRLRG